MTEAGCGWQVDVTPPIIEVTKVRTNGFLNERTLAIAIPSYDEEQHLAMKIVETQTKLTKVEVPRPSSEFRVNQQWRQHIYIR